MSHPTAMPPTRDLLLDLYRTATAAAAPGPALEGRLRRLPQQPGRRIWIVALGKAALPMASTAVEVLQAKPDRLVGGLIVAPEGSVSPDPRLTLYEGDHPEPGVRSLAAGTALADTASQIA
ncbi:MAG TPA: DUF4147 domain-containing protein, partial [Gemmatimonadales bacterium]|nr:DUF4147 domain-containing protein [Gemmatimonadales bacterium]